MKRSTTSSADFEARRTDHYLASVRERYPSVYAMLLPLWLLAWLALDWADDIFNAIGVPNVPGVGFVKSAIRFVGNMILGLVHLGVSILKPIIGDAWGAIEHAADLAAHGIYNLAGKIENGLGHLTQEAYGWVLNAIRYGEDFVNSAIRDLQHWANDAIHFVGGALEALNRDIIQPLWHFAHDAYDWVSKVAIPDVINFAKSIEHDLAGAIGAVAKDVGDIVGTIERTVLKWAPTIEKAFGWLVWFALHPFDEAASLWEQFIHFDPQGFIGGLTGALDQYGSGIEEWIVKWLGG